MQFRKGTWSYLAFICTVLWLSAAIPLAAESTGAENAVPNGDIEQMAEVGANHWLEFGKAVQVDTLNPHSGKRALKLSKGGIGGHTEVDLKPGHFYEFSVWATNSAKPTLPNWIFLRFRDAKDSTKWDEGRQAALTFTETEYTQKTTTIAVPSNVEAGGFLVFGANNDPSVDFWLDDIVVTDVTNTRKFEVQKDIPSLSRSFASKLKFGPGFQTGAAISLHSLAKKDADQLATFHYNSFTPENGVGLAGTMMTSPTKKYSGLVYDFTELDTLLKFAKDHNTRVRMHTLVWWYQIRQDPWFLQDENGKNVDRPEAIRRLTQMINKVFDFVDTNYPGLVSAWHVANECIDDNPNPADPSGPFTLRNDLWRQTIGDDYVDIAYSIAKEVRAAHNLATPGSANYVLTYNDFGNEYSRQKDRGIRDLVVRLRDKGLIEEVGMQFHVNANTAQPALLEEMFAEYRKIGLPVAITELDLSVLSGSDLSVPMDQRLVVQAYHYKSMFETFRSYKDVVRAVTFWGLTDDTNWLTEWWNAFTGGGPVKDDRGLLFDANLQAKLGYYAIMGQMDKLPIIQHSTTALNAGAGWRGANFTPLQGGDRGFQGRFSLLWNKQSLYLNLEVGDATKDEDDQVDVYWDPDRSRNSVGNGDGHLVVGRTSGRFQNRADGKGYTVSIEVPLAGLPPKATSLGFDLTVRDGSAPLLLWNDTKETQDTSTKNYGTVLLGPKPVVAKAAAGTPKFDVNSLDPMWAKQAPVSLGIVTGSTATKATAKTLWDKKALYVLFEVHDPVLSAQASDSTPWLQDSVEVFLDENNARTGVYDADDAQYRVSYLNVQSFNGINCRAEHISTRTRATDSGYLVLARIEWTTLAPTPGSILGFEVQVNDDSDRSGNRSGQLNWADSTNTGWRSMATLGYLELTN